MKGLTFLGHELSVTEYSAHHKSPLITYLLEGGAPPPLGGWKAAVFWALCCADSRTSDDRAETWKQCTCNQCNQ